MNDRAPYVNLRVGAGKFFYGSGCIQVLGREIARLGGRPLIIGGPTTTPLVLGIVEGEFAGLGIEPVVRIHTGACSRGWAEAYKKEA